MKTLGGLCAAWALVGVCLLASPARAEGPTADGAKPNDAAAAASDPDVVRLKNGGILHGKISEMMPGESVTIVTLAGKTREFPMSEVDYAGPVAKDPQASTRAPAAASEAPKQEPASQGSVKPYVVVNAPEARLHLVASEPGVTFHRQSGSAVAVGARGVAFATGFDRICTAPCDVTLPSGTETLALSRDDRPPVAADPVALPAGSSEVQGTIESRAGVRVAGFVIAIGSLVGGLALALTATSGSALDSHLDMGQVTAGVVVMGVGTPVGFVMALTHDKATIEVHHNDSASLLPLPQARVWSMHGSF